LKPKNKGPDQRVPVMRRATSDKDPNRSPRLCVPKIRFEVDASNERGKLVT